MLDKCRWVIDWLRETDGAGDWDVLGILGCGGGENFSSRRSVETFAFAFAEMAGYTAVLVLYPAQPLGAQKRARLAERSCLDTLIGLGLGSPCGGGRHPLRSNPVRYFFHLTTPPPKKPRKSMTRTLARKIKKKSRRSSTGGCFLVSENK